MGLLSGFIDSADSDNYIKAQIAGLTNTLRFKHKTVVNLPKVGKPYGEEIRGALIADEEYELCGADMSGLEDRLKQHFIYPYDPDYVNEMSNDDYDPHLSLALLGGEVTLEQVAAYKAGTDKSIKPIRDIFKNGNYACQYGAGPARLALTADISLEKAGTVWKTYWEKNWAIKKVAEEQIVKTVGGQMWLFNPISHLWYSLRYEKDRFSTLIQGTASYVFDEWVKLFRSKRPQLTGQFHDEAILQIKLGYREKCEKLLRNALQQLNEELKLNRELGIEVAFGQRYSDIH
jgi:DNA polymerase I-like protein with 3'-5' exonuclease and polymerase domains